MTDSIFESNRRFRDMENQGIEKWKTEGESQQ